MKLLATVRVRVTVGAVVVVGLTLAGGGALLVEMHRVRLERDIQAAARLRADTIADGLDRSGGVPDLDVATADANLAQVVDVGGRVVTSSPNLRGQPAISTLHPRVGMVQAVTITGLRDHHSPFRVVAESALVDGTVFTVYVARSLEAAADSTQRLAELLAAGLPFLLLVVGLITWFVTGRALRPVEEIRREVDAIGGGDLDRRVPRPDANDEIARLADTMNAMLGRLQVSDRRQRRFVEDASHELRTPLTSIRAQLEVDLAHPGRADWPTTAAGVLDDAIEMQDLVSDLLALARMEQDPRSTAPRESVDVDDVVLDEVARIRLTADVPVDAARVSGAQVLGDRGQLRRMVRNLLDNAARHAESVVFVTLEEVGDRAVLVVGNDGPTIPVEDRLRVFERFARLDDSRTADTGGTGLGLAIVREIVLAHAGTIWIDDGPETRFRVVLPAGGAPGAPGAREQIQASFSAGPASSEE